MKIVQAILLSALLTSGLQAAQPLYTQEGSDPSFAEVLKSSGVKPGEKFSKGPVLGSRIHVNLDLLEKQVGQIGSIPKDIGLHTEVCGDSIRRKEFGNWTRWYQEDHNVQIFRLFKDEQNVREGQGEEGKQGRTEVYTLNLPPVAPGTWHEWEGTYTIIKPVDACIFQVMHEGKNAQGHPLLWPVHINMYASGEIDIGFRKHGPDGEKSVTVAKNMTGKSLSFKVRSNGKDYEIYQKAPLEKGTWKFVTKGTYTESKDHEIQFRWGMYGGSAKGESISNDALLFVTGVTIRTGVR